MTKHKIYNKLTAKSTNLERLALVVAIIEPFSTLPQIIDVYTSRNVESLSLLSWVLFVVASLVWLAYGIRLKNKPLIASSVLWVTTELILVFGILIYS